ncbi:N-acetylgalactosaminyltransferase 6-like [Chironomus tepperi]|uniref:N-acetylgalactosaminyltransferase 6-like n=1 Tax=Chironomus tepperi TaxID=113505 RepID=UPI00391FAA82
MIKHSKKRLKIYSIFAILILFIVAVYSNFSSNSENEVIELRTEVVQEELIDYNDYKYMVEQLRRVGDGEIGKPVFLDDPDEIERNEKLYQKTGFYAVVSDKISVNRSVPDLRSVECREQKYSNKLPKASIIIIFHNEVLSVLKRTIHSVWNRSPSSLLHEIILVNDASTEKELYDELQQYVDLNFGKKVKIINLPERKGLIRTRMEGARSATGEVLVFFDSHMEVGYNYLPPLLAPIKDNRRISTVPIIDDFDAKNFGYYELNPTRGVIDWMWIFHEIRKELEDPVMPFSTPIMLGCAFAIDRKFFIEELGGYDEQLDIWNGENYELSFKLHLCADGLFEVPCSRVAHTFREINPSRSWKYDYVARNFKRVAEVWLDDYKEILYARDPEKFENVDPGDLTLQKKIRRDLNCKPFKHFLDVVAPDMAARYPPLRQVPVFASGTIKSVANDSNLCIYAENVPYIDMELTDCYPNLIEPFLPMYWLLTFYKQISLKSTELCMDTAGVSLFDCHYEGGNQLFKYDTGTMQIMNNNKNKTVCLTANHETRKLNFEECDEYNDYQRWEFGYVNGTAMQRWDEINDYSNM